TIGSTEKKSVADLSIRVNVNVLDSLMNLVGELVLTRNQLLQLARGDDESKYAAPITHLNRVTTDLQEGVMKTRMQPIGNAWSKLPRLVRDLSQITGKQIDLVMSGADTELDRTVLDAIKDPLTHMVRNSADHGIEPLDVRRAKGKPEIGTVRLNAFHEGGHVIICIEDDGAGIARDHVLRKAIETGLVSEADAANLSDAQVYSFIFRAGLSTAKEVSSVSGRGVGMDVVKTAIERIGGTVDLSSTPGQGTIVRIKIPLTLAIISALVVESGGELFAIPQLGIVELVRLHAEERHKIERIHDQEVFRLRDRLLPLVHLNRLLGLPDADSDHGDVNIVVVQVGEDRFGLVVSAVYDTEEIVVKPVGRLLKDVKLYQGTTILGDGRVIMILDAAAIVTRFGGRTTAASDAPKLRDPNAVDNRNTTSLLLFDAGEQTMAVPLSLVARLEEFPRNRLEQAGDRLLVQYRGDLLPLLDLKGTDSSLSGVDLQSVIVFSEGSQSLGLMVDAIRDIIQETLLIRRRSNRPGVLGTAVIGGRAIDVIDTQYYLGQVNPNWFSERESEHFKVLLIDNSSFFRQLATTALEVDGFVVTPVESAIVAVERIEHGDRYDVILSDLDLPMMDGYDFAEWFRLRPEGTDTPLVALTSVHCAMNEDKIFAAGYDCTLIKFNPDEVTRTINRLCQPAQNKCGAHV
ncbi:MAG: chemotaxis protein CheW, partial [Planctomycetaceae bacterium]